MKPLIAIPSCHKLAHLRQACRDTWVGKWGSLVDIRFFIGNPRRRGKRDEIYLDCADDYDSLPLKVRLMHQWILARDYTNVFKFDDDTWVPPSVVTRHLPGCAPTKLKVYLDCNGSVIVTIG